MNVVILTPLSLEMDAVRPHLHDELFHFDGSNSYLTGHFKGRHQSYKIIVYETGSRNSPVALATERAIQAFHPSIIILLGIAGGVKDVEIGDVAVATKAYGYESGKDTPTGFVYRPEVYLSSKPLVNQARLIAKTNDWKKRSAHAEGQNVIFGPIASGDKVIATTKSAIYQNIKHHMNDTVAIEMEAVGFGQALSNHPRIQAINIRSISDLLDHKSVGDRQGFQLQAAANAAAFAFELLYQLDPKTLNFPTMSSTKQIVKKIYDLIKSSVESELDDIPGQGDIWETVKPFLTSELQELKDDPEDEDAYAAIRNKLKRTLSQNEELKKKIEEFLKRETPNVVDKSVHIDKSKNVIQGSDISAQGDIHIGDKTEINKKYEIRDIEGNVYLADTINIERVSNAHKGPLADTQLSSVKMQVMQNKIKPAITTLLEHSIHDQDLNNQIILLASRWNQLQREKNMNTITKGQANVEYNRIRAALLDTIDEIENDF